MAFATALSNPPPIAPAEPFNKARRPISLNVGIQLVSSNGSNSAMEHISPLQFSERAWLRCLEVKFKRQLQLSWRI